MSTSGWLANPSEAALGSGGVRDLGKVLPGAETVVGGRRAAGYVAPGIPSSSAEFRVEGLGSRVEGVGLRVWG